MPPKAKKGKKGKKGKGSAVTAPEKPKTPEPTEKEVILEEELKKVTADLQNSKLRVEELRQENDWLQQEAQKVRIESHEYMSYIEKKTSKRQTTIITLSDHNKEQIENIKLEKQIMEEEYDEKKKALESMLLEKQHLLEKTNQELSNLEEYKSLQTEQLNKIKELEKEVMQMRVKHSETIQDLKVNFLQQKQLYEDDSTNKIQTLEKKANKEALQCLTTHTDNVKTENRRLRHELLKLIYETRALNDHNTELENQRKELLREKEYAEDLKNLRHARQQKAFSSDEGEDCVTRTTITPIK